MNESNRPLIELSVQFNDELLAVVPLSPAGIAVPATGEPPVRLVLRLAGEAAALEEAGRRMRPREIFYRIPLAQPLSTESDGHKWSTSLDYSLCLGGTSVTTYVYDTEGTFTRITDEPSPQPSSDAGGSDLPSLRKDPDEPPPDKPNVVG
jgi:hypothetical protein